MVRDDGRRTESPGDGWRPRWRPRWNDDVDADRRTQGGRRAHAVDDGRRSSPTGAAPCHSPRGRSRPPAATRCPTRCPTRNRCTNWCRSRSPAPPPHRALAPSKPPAAPAPAPRSSPGGGRGPGPGGGGRGPRRPYRYRPPAQRSAKQLLARAAAILPGESPPERQEAGGGPSHPAGIPPDVPQRRSESAGQLARPYVAGPSSEGFRDVDCISKHIPATWPPPDDRGGGRARGVDGSVTVHPLSVNGAVSRAGAVPTC